jgi:poly(A) polymerase
MLRAIKFAARLEFGFEPATWRALLRWRSEISKCAPPRLLEEMHRLLRGGAAYRSFELMVETNVLAVLSPYLAGLLEGSGAPTKPLLIADAAPRPTIPRVEYDEEDPAEHDPDDPDEPDEDVVAATNGKPTAGEDEDEELDVEEREWHRVWADEPPGRPALATPVKLSYLGGTELAKRRALAWAALEQMDAAIKAGRDPSNAVAFGVLIAPFIHFAGDVEPRGNMLQGAINEVSQPLITQLHVTRRDSERLRYLLIAQRRLSAARRRNIQAELAGGRELIDDATLLYTLLERAAGNDATLPETVAKAEGAGEGDEGDEDDPNQPRKRRRRRRGGRRRRPETTA